jgi:CO/xanthine dehydrogenase FAD-binding subunit
MRFDYLQPATVEESLALLAEHGGDAKLVAGGTTVMRQARMRALDANVLIDLTGVAGLTGIWDDGYEGLRIGSMATIRDLELSPLVRERFPMLAKAAGMLGSVAIRNVGTIGGNLCNASPAAECAPALLCLAAKVRIIGPKGERVLPLDDFFTTRGVTVVGNDEILAAIEVPASGAGLRSAYLKNSPRGTIDRATVGVAAAGILGPDGHIFQEIKIALGGAAPTPIRAKGAEQVLHGKSINEAVIAAAARAAASESNPYTDVQATAEYRREMVGVYTRRVLHTIFPAE